MEILAQNTIAYKITLSKHSTTFLIMYEIQSREEIFVISQAQFTNWNQNLTMWEGFWYTLRVYDVWGHAASKEEFLSHISGPSWPIETKTSS